MKTIDGGTNWTLQGSEFTPNPIINLIIFLNQDLGFAAGTSVYKTTNGGSNWTHLPLIHGDQIISMHLINTQIGFSLGFGYNELYKTTDGGASWTQLFVEPNVYLNKISFVNDSIGYIISSDKVYISTNQGTTWTKQNSPYHWGLSDISFVSSHRGWIVGTKGLIMNTTNGGITFVEIDNRISQPGGFVLYQNYPNPFNGVTSIEYSVLSSERVKLKIYDVLGCEVATLVDEVKEPGNYNSQFSIIHCPQVFISINFELEISLRQKKCSILSDEMIY